MPHVTPLLDSDPRRAGRYQLAGRIAGLPAAGPVFLARSPGGGEVTVMLMDSEVGGGSAARDRFADEAAGARRVAPFCAARILDAGLDGGQPFLVSEYVSGPSLLEVVAAAGPLGTGDLELLAIGAATGLAAIHQAGLVHGSFGPEHLIIGSDGPRVIAFGVTPPYGPATPSADLLTWAQTIGFAAAGRPPDGSADLAPLPPRLRRIVTECLSAAPAARPHARQVLRELLGPGDPAAGLLAEGARRAAPAARLARAAGGRAQAAAAPQPRPLAGRGGRAWWTAAAVLVALGVAAAGVREIQDDSRTGGHHGPGPGHASPSATAPGRPSSAVPSAPPARAAIPAALAGSWSGQVRQGGPVEKFGVRVVLRTGASSGTISYAGTSFACTGKLSVISAGPGQLGLRQQIVTGRKTCADGMVTVRLQSPGTLLFAFRGSAGPQADGTLRH